MSKKTFAYGLSLPVLYHLSRTGGQQLFRQTAKAHVDHIAEGLKKTTGCTLQRVGFLLKHEEANPLVKMESQ